MRSNPVIRGVPADPGRVLPVSSHRSVNLVAPAKVNLFLRVLDRRPDGFHEIETLFQAIDLYDEVEVALTDSGVTLEVAGADLGPTEENLAYRAARAMLAETGPSHGVHVRLEKHIPAGAGLGGGSSDAAAVLKAAQEMRRLPRRSASGSPRWRRCVPTSTPSRWRAAAA